MCERYGIRSCRISFIVYNDVSVHCSSNSLCCILHYSIRCEAPTSTKYNRLAITPSGILLVILYVVINYKYKHFCLFNKLMCSDLEIRVLLQGKPVSLETLLET